MLAAGTQNSLITVSTNKSVIEITENTNKDNPHRLYNKVAECLVSIALPPTPSSSKNETDNNNHSSSAEICSLMYLWNKTRRHPILILQSIMDNNGLTNPKSSHGMNNEEGKTTNKNTVVLNTSSGTSSGLATSTPETSMITTNTNTIFSSPQGSLSTPQDDSSLPSSANTSETTSLPLSAIVQPDLAIRIIPEELKYMRYDNEKEELTLTNGLNNMSIILGSVPPQHTYFKRKTTWQWQKLARRIILDFARFLEELNESNETSSDPGEPLYRQPLTILAGKEHLPPNDTSSLSYATVIKQFHQSVSDDNNNSNSNRANMLTNNNTMDNKTNTNTSSNHPYPPYPSLPVENLRVRTSTNNHTNNNNGNTSRFCLSDSPSLNNNSPSLSPSTFVTKPYNHHHHHHPQQQQRYKVGPNGQGPYTTAIDSSYATSNNNNAFPSYQVQTMNNHNNNNNMYYTTEMMDHRFSPSHSSSSPLPSIVYPASTTASYPMTGYFIPSSYPIPTDNNNNPSGVSPTSSTATGYVANTNSVPSISPVTGPTMHLVPSSHPNAVAPTVWMTPDGNIVSPASYVNIVATPNASLHPSYYQQPTRNDHTTGSGTSPIISTPNTPTSGNNSNTGNVAYVNMASPNTYYYVKQ